MKIIRGRQEINQNNKQDSHYFHLKGKVGFPLMIPLVEVSLPDQEITLLGVVVRTGFHISECIVTLGLLNVGIWLGH